jgi:hypothetical protein
MQGLRPTKAELESQFRGYVDQAALLIQRIDEGQPWEDFKLGDRRRSRRLAETPFKIDFPRSTAYQVPQEFSIFICF